MWHLVKKLPWRGILLAILINAFLVGLYAMGYRSGHDSAKRDGDTALSQLQSAFDAYKTEQATLENAALRAWARRYQEQVAAGQRAEAGYLEQIAQQYNAALGYDNASVDTGHSDSVAATGTRSGTATGQPETTDTRLRDSGVSQRDVLANIIDNAWQCRRWRNQINALLDEREGLQK